MKPIPIVAARNIAEQYGYDQVIIYARKVGDAPKPHGEHMTTYGRTPLHCNVAARIAKYLQTEIMGWYQQEQSSQENNNPVAASHP